MCYVMGDSDLDGRGVDLREALEEIVGDISWGNFISCIPGRLGYFGGKSRTSDTSWSGSSPPDSAGYSRPSASH